MGKNDLSSLKIKQEKKLPDEINVNLLERKVGRPKKSVNECESKVISLKITPDEYAVLKEKAGLIPLGRYIKHQLRDKTDIFK
jgi:hypothetical protein